MNAEKMNAEKMNAEMTVFLFRVLDDCKLVHPVHEGMAFFHNAFQLAPDAGDEFIASQQVVRVDRHLFGFQQVGLDPVLLEFNPVNESALFKLFYNPRTLAAVNTKFLPEFALEDTFGS